ncbi:MAG: hypothetical protein QM699_05595 [Amaricoccus sp.]|uniref:hypothetical protein n=1 Tax=Amaricoccus sp. TaxID=1872485 RepID=UPI0039E556DD
MKGDDPDDPRGLIREAYRMEIGPAEARTIFLDWALGLVAGDGRAEIARLLARHGAAAPEHPMTAVLREGLEPPRDGRPRARRRR